MSSKVFTKLLSPRDTVCFGSRVKFFGGPALDGSLVADVPVGVALFVCSLRFPRCARREMCVLSDGETIECGPLVVRSDCENKSSGTERVGSLESGVPRKQSRMRERAHSSGNNRGVRRETTSVQISSTYYSRGHRIKKTQKNILDAALCPWRP